MSHLLLTSHPAIDAAVERLISQVDTLFPALQCGYYLHGSWGTRTARLHSDVDILAVTLHTLTPDQRTWAKEVAARISLETGIPLDFHLHSIDALMRDPYIDLGRTGVFITGTDVRTFLPRPSLDLLAREAVSISCQYITEIRGCATVSWPLTHPDPSDPFLGRFTPEETPSGLAKMLTWMASAYLAGTYGYAPTSASDALQTLQAEQDSYSTWLVEAVMTLREIPDTPPQEDSVGKLSSICLQTLAFECATLTSIRNALATPHREGEQCARILNQYILFS